MPVVTVRAALASDPFSSGPSWTDISAYFVGASIRGGRSDSLGQFEARTCTLILDNRDRRFDPFYTSGPYTTTFRPGKRVNLRATWLGVIFDVYTGYIDRIRPVWPSPADAMVEVELVDAFSILNRKDLLRDNYRTEVLANSPRAYYRMGDAAGSVGMADSSGNGRDGTYSGSGKVAAPGGVYGDPGGSMDTGAGTNSATGATAAGLTGGPPFAVDMLVYYGGVPPLTNNRILFDQDVGGGGRFVIRVLDNSKVRVDCWGGPVDSVATLRPFAWNYVSVGVDSLNNYRIRINGTAVVTSNVYTGAVLTQNAPTIGAGTTGLGWFGYIDEVAIYTGSIPTDSNTLTHFGWSSARLNDQIGSDRLTVLLDQIGWPAGDRDFTASTHTLTPVIEPLAGESLLQHFQDVAKTEFGLLYVNGAGQIVFTDEIPTSAPGSLVTFGEGTGEVHYPEGPGAEYSWEFVANEILAKAVPRAGLVDAYVTDAASVTAYGPRTLTVDGLLFRDQADLDDRADRLLADRKDPKKRIKSVKVRAQDDTANVMPAILGILLGDTVTVKRTPVGGGSAISVPSLVDGVSHTITPDTWVTEFALSPW